MMKTLQIVLDIVGIALNLIVIILLTKVIRGEKE